MSTRKGSKRATPAQGVIVTPAPMPAAEEDEPLPGDPSDRALLTLLSELAGSANAKVTVYRYRKNEPLTWLFGCHPEAFELEALRDKYNGGQFKLYITRDGVPIRNTVLNVEAPARLSAEQGPAAGADVVIAVRDAFEKQAALLRELKPAPPPSLDIPALLQAATGMIAALRTASQPLPAPAPPPPAPSPSASLDSMIGILQKGIDLGRTVTTPEASGNGEGLSGIVQTLLRSPIMSAIVEAVRAQAPAVPAQQRVFAAPQAPPPPPAVAPAPTAAAAGGPMDMQAMRAALAQLVAKARNNSDPILYADWILDNVPNGQVRALVVQVDLLEQLVRLNPEVQMYRPWFESLRASLLEALELPPHTGLTAEAGSANGTADAARPDAGDFPRPAT
jgi:hypothetical protein